MDKKLFKNLKCITNYNLSTMLVLNEVDYSFIIIYFICG